MEIKRGIPVSPGVTIGPALVLDTESYRIPQRFVGPDHVEAEVWRVEQAIEAAARAENDNKKDVKEQIGRQWGAIFGAHQMLIEDPALGGEIVGLIRKQRYAAEYAVSVVMRGQAKALESLGQSLFAARATDLFDIEKSILRNLLGQSREQLQQLQEAVVVLAHDLTPSETAAMD